jgi:hypothetical protein
MNMTYLPEKGPKRKPMKKRDRKQYLKKRAKNEKTAQACFKKNPKLPHEQLLMKQRSYSLLLQILHQRHQRSRRRQRLHQRDSLIRLRRVGERQQHQAHHELPRPSGLQRPPQRALGSRDGPHRAVVHQQQEKNLKVFA